MVVLRGYTLELACYLRTKARKSKSASSASPAKPHVFFTHSEPNVFHSSNPHNILIFLPIMEKPSELPVSEEYATSQRSRLRRRRLCGIDDVIFFIVLCLVASVIWCSEIRALLPNQRHKRGELLSVEDRVTKILEENPLIGQHSAYHDITALTCKRRP